MEGKYRVLSLVRSLRENPKDLQEFLNLRDEEGYDLLFISADLSTLIFKKR